ncbi:hypothetical protein [Haloferax sp. Atlit-19N]|uniref:hypothetical protein n=1 Tax=Haloferax sp. Atlit-19N TaxID=2077201 RepID=UPI0011C01A3C|nr:hypothetical protein [Haloferax sp. Atlit-19N]
MSLTSQTHTGRFEPRIPGELGGTNPLVLALFDDTETGTAYCCDTDDGAVYVMPWNGSGGKIAAYTPGETADSIPTELDAEQLRLLLTEHQPRTVRINQTPARTLLGNSRDRDVAVSWHARCRWAERVEETADPEPHIRAALTDSVELSRNRGWYNPTLDIRIPVSGLSPVYEDRLDVDWIVTTVLRTENDDLGFNP